MTLNKILLRLTLTVVSAFFMIHGFAQTNEDSTALATIAAHRAKQEAEFRDPEESPLSKEDFKTFKGLKYFPVDLKYHVKARFVKNEKPEMFKMKTSTTRLPNYRKYATVYFTLDGQQYSLEVYQSPDLMKQQEYVDYLFVPFTDKTNGNETYDVGRYLELRIPESDEVTLDFNLCYNPYCSYDHRFSCPIPPAANDLPIEIRAGELKYKGH
jgi:uncharacterized protein (DUF1684 family)